MPRPSLASSAVAATGQAAEPHRSSPIRPLHSQGLEDDWKLFGDKAPRSASVTIWGPHIQYLDAPPPSRRASSRTCLTNWTSPTRSTAITTWPASDVNPPTIPSMRLPRHGRHWPASVTLHPSSEPWPRTDRDRHRALPRQDRPPDGEGTGQGDTWSAHLGLMLMRMWEATPQDTINNNSGTTSRE